MLTGLTEADQRVYELVGMEVEFGGRVLCGDGDVGPIEVVDDDRDERQTHDAGSPVGRVVSLRCFVRRDGRQPAAGRKRRADPPGCISG